MKVVVAEISQETNSFCPVHTTLSDYRRYGICFGQEYRESVRNIEIESEGIFTALEQEGIDYVPAIRMRAQASGKILPEVSQYFIESLDKVIDENPGLDGAVFSFHGATQSTESDDVCGDIVKHVREKLGRHAVIATSYDLHANITEKIYDNTDIICGYLTYPHVDFYGAGYRAAKLCARMLSGKEHTHIAWCSVPMIVPASGYNTSSGVFSELVNKAKKMVQDGLLIDYSIFQMQPWLDVSSGGSAIITISDSAKHAITCVQELSDEFKAIRHAMVPQLYSVEEIIKAGMKNDSGKPIILVDFSDSANAGAAGDNSDVLAKILELGAEHVDTALAVTDEPAVERAFHVGIGNTGDFEIGGTKDKNCSKPVKVRARVRSLHDGDFKLDGPSRGIVRHLGTCAVISVGKIDILVTRTMASTGDTQLYRHFGIEPMFYKLVAVKANISFYASYSNISSKIMFTDTGCAATADLKKLSFTRLPKSFHPFSDIDDFNVAAHIKVK